MTTPFEPRFGDCKLCEHFRKKEPCRFDKGCHIGEFFEERLEDCVTRDEAAPRRAERRHRYD